MSLEGWRKRARGDGTLSERQMAVLGLLAEGRTNREIGEALGMTLDGAKWHVGEIISKLGVASREEARRGGAKIRVRHGAMRGMRRSRAQASQRRRGRGRLCPCSS